MLVMLRIADRLQQIMEARYAAAVLGWSVPFTRQARRVYGTQRLQHIPAFFREVRGNIYNLPPSMRQTVGQQNFHTRQLWRVPRESVAHLNERIALGARCAHTEAGWSEITKRLLFSEYPVEFEQHWELPDSC